MSILPEDDDRLLLFFTCKQLSVGVAGTLLSYDGRKDQEDKLKYFRIGDFLRFFDLYPNFRSQSRDLHVSLDLPKFLVWEAGLTRLPVVSIEPLYNTLRPLGLLYQAARGRNKGRSSLSNRIRRSAADLATVSLHLLLKSAGLGPLVDWTRRWRNLGIPEVSGAVVWMPDGFISVLTMDGATYALRISDKQDTGSCNYAALRLIRSDGVTLGRTLYGGSWTLDLKMSMSKPELLLGFNETSLFGIDLLSGSVWRAGQNNLSDDSKENLRLPVRLNGHENGVIQIRHSISSGQRPEIIVDAMKELGFIVSIVQAEAGQGVPIRIRMNKWYHGRVIGLLGNSDGEANNDIVTTNPVHPVGSSTEKSRISVGVNKHGDRKTWMSKALKYHVVDKYIESTTLSSSEEKKCRLVLDEGINYATESATIQGIIDMFSNTPKCGFLLRAPISPFAHCFDAVNVQPYLRLCNLLKDQGTYAVIQLYASACSDAKVNIPQNVPWPSANSVNFSTVPVVFIVNHDSFRTNAQMLKAIQGLSSLSKAITSGHDHLHNPIKVTFGLIGFSDSLLTTVIYGHSTKASSSWLTTASLAELDSSLERLIDNSSILCERSIQDASVTGLSGYADATELALKMVSLIEFHSPPLFVLIAGDSGCPRANLSTDHETKITNELIESQANLVFASEFNYREPPGGHRSLLGVDRYHAYSPRHPGGRRLAGIEAPRPPEDACASWALESAAWGLAWDVRTFPDEISKRLVMQAVSLSAKQTIS